ncbi:hypothetical protein XENOCAPTIV_025556 [Xenoophorus captivus]|uniref:Uncharacterized protein n=1 Tax=Xenoophorus captivus TaxID=1517983 RepID=A0ABV0QLP7_9TELE
MMLPPPGFALEMVCSGSCTVSVFCRRSCVALSDKISTENTCKVYGCNVTKCEKSQSCMSTFARHCLGLEGLVILEENIFKGTQITTLQDFTQLFADLILDVRHSFRCQTLLVSSNLT